MGALRKSDDFFVRQEPIQLHGKKTTAYYDTYGDVWFEAREQCEKLGLKNVTRALNSIPAKGKTKILVRLTSSKLMLAKRMGTKSIESLFVNEFGLNKLIFKSKKPEALRYQDWVLGELLPFVRKLGGHSIGEYETIKLDGKIIRRLETDVIKQFVAYAIDQGANERGASMYYAHISNEVNKQLKIKSRDSATTEQLKYVELLDRACKVSLVRGMESDIDYKTCYKVMKTELSKFVELIDL